MIGMLLTPTLSPHAGRGRTWLLAPRQRREEGARLRGKVRGRWNRSVGASIFLALILVLALGGCGKRNAPEPPPGAPDTYPRPYPSE